MGVPQSNLSTSYVKEDPEPATVLSSLRTVPERLRYFADNFPKKEAVVFASMDGPRQAVTFKELYEKSISAAKSYIHLGVKKDEFVAINVRPCPEWLYITFGAMMAGLRPVSVSFTYKDGSDLVALVDKIQTCSCMIMDPGFEGENWTILSQLLDNYSPDGSLVSHKMPSLRYLIVHDVNHDINGVKTLADFLTTKTPDVVLPEITENDIASLFQTSGSTGTPKLAVHTHRSALNLFGFPKSSVFSAEDTYFCDRPFTWTGGFPFGPLYGQTRVTISGFCPPPTNRAEYLLKVVMEEKCQTMLGLPTVIHEMFELGKDKLSSDEWPLKTVATGGQPITMQTISCLKELCKSIAILYGATEFGLTNIKVVSSVDDFQDFSTGFVLPGHEIKIVDGDGNTVPINTRGEVYSRGNSLFAGYVNDPEKTKAVLTDDGWYKTDDIGIMLEDGSLKVLGRKSHVIISGGMNVDPAILENLFCKCPGVDSVILIPIPDEVLYQVICACVKVVSGSGVDEAVVRKFCEDAHSDALHLFTVLPKYYLILDKFPETHSGKISRIDLTEMAMKKFKQ